MCSGIRHFRLIRPELSASFIIIRSLKFRESLYCTDKKYINLTVFYIQYFNQVLQSHYGTRNDTRIKGSLTALAITIKNWPMLHSRLANIQPLPARALNAGQTLPKGVTSAGDAKMMLADLG